MRPSFIVQGFQKPSFHGWGLTEGIQTGFLTITATFTKAGHGIFLVISAYIRSGTVIRFDNQTSRVSLILWRTHHPDIAWPSLSSRGLFQCCASVSLGVPIKGSAWSAAEVVASQPAWSHVWQGSSQRHLALFLSSCKAQLLSSTQPWPRTQPCKAGVHSTSSLSPMGQPSCLSYCVSPCQRSGQCKNYFPFAAERARRNIQLINRMSWLE